MRESATIDRHFPCRCSIMIADSRRFDLGQLPAAGGRARSMPPWPKRVAFGAWLRRRRTPMMQTVRLEMARCHEFAEGSSAHGYELHLPLTPSGKLDRDFWLNHREGGGFRRFWGDEEERGLLRHGRKGWALSFEPHREDDQDEMIFKGDQHRFIAGEYISITERDGVTRTFRIAAVT
jgi:hypothetical protein